MYLIIPTNEGQDLNYCHTFRGRTLPEAETYARWMRNKLQETMSQGSIGVRIENRNGKEVVWMGSGENATWQIEESKKPKTRKN